MSELITHELQAGVLRIGINRPEKKNALLAPMYAAMTQALARAEADPAVKAIVIHGSREAFTAGNDLKDFLDNPPSGPDSAVFAFLHAIRDARKPLIAAVAGVAVGVGTTLLLHCDLVFAGANARFQLPFVSLGLCPEAGSSLLLPRLAGYPRAAEMLLLGEPFDAQKAREVGLVNAVCGEDEVLERAMAAARRIAALPAASVRATKALMKSALGDAVARQMEAEGQVFKDRLVSPEAREAFAAFLEKRKPDFGRFS